MSQVARILEMSSLAFSRIVMFLIRPDRVRSWSLATRVVGSRREIPLKVMRIFTG